VSIKQRQTDDMSGEPRAIDKTSNEKAYNQATQKKALNNGKRPLSVYQYL
jgi:hypothetical protein